MKATVFHKRGLVSGDDALAEALTSDNEVTRIMARGAAGTWLADFSRWVNDEVNRPKANPPAILNAMAVLQWQTIASVAAQLLDEDGDRKFVQVYLETAENELTRHMARTRTEAAEGWS